MNRQARGGGSGSATGPNTRQRPSRRTTARSRSSSPRRPGTPENLFQKGGFGEGEPPGEPLFPASAARQESRPPTSGTDSEWRGAGQCPRAGRGGSLSPSGGDDAELFHDHRRCGGVPFRGPLADRRSVPYLRRLVVAGGDDPRPVRAERRRPLTPVCPLSERTSAPVLASQTFAVMSSLAVTTRDPSGLNDAELTTPVCPLSVRSSAPVWASHTFAVLSALAVTTRDPSGLNDAE